MKLPKFVVFVILSFLVLLPFCLAVPSGSDSGSIGIVDDGNMITVGVIPPQCGDGHLDAGEQCDGSVSGLTCADIDSGLQGSLSCTDGCTMDTSQCSSNSATTSGGGGGHHSPSPSVISTSSSSTKCYETWQCASWSECIDGSQARTCNDSSKCGTVTLKPETTRTCENLPNLKESDGESGFLSGITGAVIGTLGKNGGVLALSMIVLLFVLAIIVAFFRNKSADVPVDAKTGNKINGKKEK